MYKYVLTAMIIVLFCYGVSFGQCDHSIFVADEDDLPYAGSPYNPCGNMFSYVFEFDILRYSNPTNNVIVYPQVISSDLDISVNSIRYTPGTYNVKDDDIFTGTGADYLKIDILLPYGTDVFANMDWSVHYYSDKPD